MKVCFVSHTSRTGGAERSLLETIRSLRARGVECVVLLPGNGRLAGALDRMRIDYRVLPYKWWTARAGGPLWRRAARTAANLILAVPASLWIRRRSADIVYTNTISTCLGAWAAALAGRPHVWHIRELGHDHNRSVFDLGETFSLRVIRALSAVCLANSFCVAEKYRDAVDPKEMKVVYQAVQLDPNGCHEPERAPAGTFRFVVVGAISPAKRQEEAIRAVARLIEQGVRTELLIVGEGDRQYERQLRELVVQLNLKDRVQFVGQLDSACSVIRASDAVVTCSRHEAFGRVTVEAMLAGKPVVGARSGGTAELIRDGHNGFLYEPGDVDQLAGILRRLIESPEGSRRLGEAARAWATEQFTEKRFGDEILACLAPLVGATS